MYLILCCSYLNHSLRFVGEKKRKKNKSHSQYFGKKIAITLFSQIVQPYLEVLLKLADPSALYKESILKGAVHICESTDPAGYS